MPEQVIVIDGEGTAETLRTPGGLDLRETGGKVSMTRVSEIRMDEETGKFFIEFLHRKLEGRVFCKNLERALTADFVMRRLPLLRQGETVLFDSYEEAVAVEVATINRIREAVGVEII